MNKLLVLLITLLSLLSVNAQVPFTDHPIPDDCRRFYLENNGGGNLGSTVSGSSNSLASNNLGEGAGAIVFRSGVL